MKPPKILKGLINFCYAIMLLAAISTPLELLVFKLTDTPVTFEINNRIINSFTTPVIFLCVFRYSLIIFDVYILYLLKKLVESLFENKLYSANQIHLFKKVGLLIIYSSLSKIISGVLSFYFIGKKSGFRISFDIGFNNLLSIIAVGLLFVFLSKVFQNAKSLKQENDLTV